MKPQRKTLGVENKDNLLVAHAGAMGGCTFLYIPLRAKNTENELKPP
jgi:hypothetical protein